MIGVRNKREWREGAKERRVREMVGEREEERGGDGR